MNTTKSIRWNDLINAVEQYVKANPDGPQIQSIPSHIGADGLAYGYSQSADETALRGIEEIADRVAVVAA